MEHVLDWQDCFSDEELSHFVEEFLADGMVEDHLAVFPVSKSSYALFLNGSQFDRFSAETQVAHAAASGSGAVPADSACRRIDLVDADHIFDQQ